MDWGFLGKKSTEKLDTCPAGPSSFLVLSAQRADRFFSACRAFSFNSLCAWVLRPLLRITALPLSVGDFLGSSLPTCLVYSLLRVAVILSPWSSFSFLNEKSLPASVSKRKQLKSASEVTGKASPL